ncbi:MAG: hypothetical protein ACI845_002739, partial [Gammaproteobacteria bacterium]
CNQKCPSVVPVKSNRCPVHTDTYINNAVLANLPSVIA